MIGFCPTAYAKGQEHKSAMLTQGYFMMTTVKRRNEIPSLSYKFPQSTFLRPFMH